MNTIYSCPEHYAQDIIKSFNLTPPIDLDQILKCFEININYESLDKMEALLIISTGKKNIILNNVENRNINRDRFTIAHEIGHYIIPWHENLQFDDTIDFNCDDKVECEANNFASELLVPKEYIIKEVEGQKPSLVLIKRLADKYSVSLVVMARRILQYTNIEAVAVIYYPNGRKYIQMQSPKLNWKLKSGKIESSLAHKLIKDYKSSVEAREILDYDVWFDKNNEGNHRVVEESIYQSRLGRVFTLIRKADDEDELALSWDY